MNKFTIEVLYPEFNNLYGDTGNIDYLVKKLEKSPLEIEIIYTNINDTPSFTTDKNIDFLYIGPCTEKNQLVEIEVLRKYKDDIINRMESNKISLVTGNSLELFGKNIITANGDSIDALGIFDFYSKRFNNLRYNDLSLGKFNDIDIVGYKNQLSHSYLNSNINDNFLEIKKGSGFNPELKIEGIHKNNFYATYILGPILTINPIFTDKILSDYLGENYIENELPFEQKAYELRLKEIATD